MRNRASLCKIMPVVQANNLLHAQDRNAVRGADSARSQLDRAVRQVIAGPWPGQADRAGPRPRQADRGVLQSEAGPGNQADMGVQQARAGSGVGAEKAILQAEAVLKAGAGLADPGLLGVLRARPGTQAGEADSGLGQSTVRAGPGHTQVLGPPRACSSSGSPRGSSHLLEGSDRSGSSRPSLGSLSPLHEGEGSVPHIGQSEVEIQKPDQVIQIPLASPTDFSPLRRGSRIRN